MSSLCGLKITKRFTVGPRELEILRGIDLEVSEGESLAVLGVSGAGKSTLLHILGGLEQPSSGSVTFDAQDLYALCSDKLARFRNQRLGFIFQFHHLLPEFSAQENVMMPCLLAGWPRIRARERALEVLEGVGLAGRVEHRPGKLSGGERQRVAIARALVLSPSVLLADEPTGNLDSQTASSVEDVLLEQVANTGAALIMVTHNEHLAGRLSKKRYLVDGQMRW